MDQTPHGNFNYPSDYRIGAGRISELPELCRAHHIEAPLVVSDPGVRALPWFTRIEDILQKAGLAFSTFSEIAANPDEAQVMAGLRQYKEGGHDGLLLIGGGSAMDVGKCIALMAHAPGKLFDYEDGRDDWLALDPQKIPNCIAVPTTAGTGSEVGRASVILNPEHDKKIIFHPRMMPVAVLADPELCLGLPQKLTAWTGMDALAHCLEAYCSPHYHPMAQGIALEGMALIKRWLPRAYQHGEDLEARGHMLMAASMGATAFQKGLGLIHALSHPLGGEMGIHHGLANAIFMPYCLEYNRPALAEKLDAAARYLGLSQDQGQGFDALMSWVLELRKELKIPHSLAEFPEIDESMLRRLVPRALEDPSMGGNPRTADADAVFAVFMATYRGDLSKL